MPAKKKTTFKELKTLRLVRSSNTSALLAGQNGLIELTALDHDVFRLRATSNKRFSNKRSYAVVNANWTGGDVRISIRKNAVALRSDTSKFSLRLSDAHFRLFSDSGEAASSCAMGFQGGSPQLQLQLAEDEHLFGLGETTGAFNKRGLIREFWNTDVLGHAPAIYPGMKALYVSIPFAITMRDGIAAGLFWDNPARQRWDMGSTESGLWKLTAELGEIDLYLFLGPTVENVVRNFSRLTGRMPMPPKWALGFHQCRYSYESRKEVEDVARTMRRKRIPCDAIYLDIHHMDGYRVFTFGKTFPKPKEMVQQLDRKGFKVVAIVDPGVKNDPRFRVLKRGRKLDAFVRDESGKKDYVGAVWPGKSRYPDFLREEVRTWWAREHQALLKVGIAGVWNDMNEPANFARPDKTLPPNAKHRTDHGVCSHKEVHNVYGSMMAKASREGLQSIRSDERPFVITRAGYAGVQRDAMVWTGDNSSTWYHLEDSIQMLLNLAMSGVPFCGCDAGGFLDNCTPELFVRWMQCAAFTPFFRNHTDVGTTRQEPWAFGPEAESIARHYIELRYQLLPYLYSLFDIAARHGTPIMRPLFWHYTEDLNAVDTGDQFLLGRDLMIAPITKQGAVVRSVYLPEGVWYSYWTDQPVPGRNYTLAHAPLDTLPMFVRGGGLIPTRAVQQYTGENPLTELTLHHWVNGMGSLDFYDDNGMPDAPESNSFCRRSILASSSAAAGGRLSASPQSGDYASPQRTWRVVLHGASRKPRFKLNGRAIQSQTESATGLCFVELPHSDSAFELTWK